MQTDIIAAVLHNVVALIGLWFLVFFCRRSYRLDALREKLFGLRHELFSLAEGGKIKFDEPAYYLLRTQLNRMIRYAHRLNGIAAVAWPRTTLESPRKRWIESLRDLPESTAKSLRGIEERMALAVLWHLASGSLMFTSVLVLQILRIVLVNPHSGRRPESVAIEAMGPSIDALESRAAQEEREVLAGAGV